MLCPCCSHLDYKECCEPFHKGLLPEKASQLMRSRYVAYAKTLPDYIMNTTHPASRQYMPNRRRWKEQIVDFCKSTQFERLEIVKEEQQETQATVSFIATLKQNGKDVSFKEKSYFFKVNGKWLYKDGEIEPYKSAL